MKVTEKMISVIMAAYNSEAFIEEAIYSILNQTHKNLELIIVNDCSTDNTEQKILAKNDGRIKYFRNQEKYGPGKSRNIALKNAQGEFIAIMDSDDIAIPDRLEIQLNYLEKHAEIDVLGSAIKLFGNTREKIICFPGAPQFITCWLLFNNCIHNPSVFFRRALIDKNLFSYNNFWFGQDYHLWYLLSKKNIQFTNLSKVLLHYRVHPKQITNQALEKRAEEIKSRLAERIYETFQIEIPADQYYTITTFINTRLAVAQKEFDILKHFFTHLYMENKRRKIYNNTYLAAVLYFFFLRLGKYYYLEKKKPLKFLKYFSAVVYMLGIKSFYIFLRNNKGYR